MNSRSFIPLGCCSHLVILSEVREANFWLAVRASYILPILKHSLSEKLETHREVLFLPLDIKEKQTPVCRSFQVLGWTLKTGKVSLKLVRWHVTWLSSALMHTLLPATTYCHRWNWCNQLHTLSKWLLAPPCTFKHWRSTIRTGSTSIQTSPPK